jgi:pimeloyl-ACP methyl ester carboxylesterase
VADRLDGARPLIGLDLRGHGDSEKPAQGYTIEEHARDVACAMRARGLGPIPIVGHSFGAYVAAAVAANDPQLVSSLIFVDGGYPPMPPPGISVDVFIDLATAHSLARVEKTYSNMEACIEGWRALPGLAGAHPEWVVAYAGYDTVADGALRRAKTNPAAVRAAYRDMSDVAAIEARLASLRVPLVLIRAAFGAARGLPPLISDDVVASIQRKVPRLGVHTVDETNHYTILFADHGATRVARLLEEIAS